MTGRDLVDGFRTRQPIQSPSTRQQKPPRVTPAPQTHPKMQPNGQSMQVNSAASEPGRLVGATPTHRRPPRGLCAFIVHECLCKANSKECPGQLRQGTVCLRDDVYASVKLHLASVELIFLPSLLVHSTVMADASSSAACAFWLTAVTEPVSVGAALPLPVPDTPC